MRNCNAVFSRSVAIRLFVVADADHYDPMLVCCQYSSPTNGPSAVETREPLSNCCGLPVLSWLGNIYQTIFIVHISTSLT